MGCHSSKQAQEVVGFSSGVSGFKIGNRNDVWNGSNECSLIYNALNTSKSEIRLLRASRSSSGAIECDLSTCSLNDAPKYYALSYVWGDPTVTSDILVNGKSFSATANLVAALENVVVNLERSFIWIDAICINQADIRERNSQVQIMASIYKKAYSVLGWLGPEQDHSTEVIEIIRQMAREITSSGIEIGVDLLSRTADQEFLSRLGPNLSGRSLLSLALPRAKDFRLLLEERPFWKRAWILQEMVLAERLAFVCGQAAFTHYDLRGVWAWLSSIKPPAKPDSFSWTDWISFKIDLEMGLNTTMAGFAPMVRIEATTSQHGPYIAAWDVLTHSWPFAATDPRDKIYSLLGLINIGMKADYSKSPQIVYQQLADIMFCRVPRDEWLARAGLCIHNRIPALPTWVVDWNSLTKGDFAATISGDLYNANSEMLDFSNKTMISGRSLTIYGILCDEVEFLAPFPGDTDLNAKEAFKFDLTGGLQGGEVLNTLIPPGVPRAQASLRLCLDDIDLYEKRRFRLNPYFLSLAMHYIRLLQLADPQGLAYTYENDPANFTNLLLGEHPSRDTFDAVIGEQGPSSEGDKEKAFWLRYPQHFARARHFYTRKGYIGHGPKCLQKGDLICILQDCRVPVVLRKVGRHYQFVSTCLVLGLMDGEAAQLLKGGKASMERFTIH